ncbi:Zinc finger CCCH domain-containing protein 32 [Linum perenne]
MEEELLKQNTDCVYFLASPPTWTECEYHHKDMARLNPRDCWYWLSGSCLNPTCAFRHPTDTLFPPEHYNEDSSYMGADLNLEEHVDDHIEPEEPWESSPGFDVIVENEDGENLCYEVDQDYMVALDTEQRVVDNQFVDYDFEEPDHFIHLGLSESRELDLRDHLKK